MKNIGYFKVILSISAILLFGVGLFAQAAPTATTNSATSVTGTTATLNATVNANGSSTTVTFEYGTSSDFEGEAPFTTIAGIPSPVTGTSDTAVSAAISGLDPGTLYFFRVVAVNAIGTTNGIVIPFTTEPLAAVFTGIASPVTTTTATLNGIVNANNNSTTVTFEYGLTAAYGTTVTAAPSPVTGNSVTVVSASIGSLTANTTYHFRVVGVNALGASNGEDMTFFTSAQAAPTATTNDATYNDIGNPNTANLNGTVNANNADAIVTFEYGLTNAYGTTVTADQSPVLGSSDTAVIRTISGLTADTTYHYRVVAVNSQGTTNGADMTFFNTAAPYARTDAATPIGLNAATINGTVNPKRFEASGDTTVTFEYGLTNAYGSSATAIQSPLSGGVEQTVSLGLTGLTTNTTYHYRVTATSPSGTGTGADMTFTTSSLPIVTTDTASPVGTTSATLNGTVNANGDSTTVTFEYGATDSYGTTVTAVPSPATGTADTSVSYNLTGLTNGALFHYRVVGTNSSGTSYGEDKTFTSGVSPASVTTNAATSVGNTSATLNGTINANGSTTSVSFEWGETIAYGRSGVAVPGSIGGTTNTATSLNLSGLNAGTLYHYRLVGENTGGIIYGSDMTFTTSQAPIAVTNSASAVNTTVATLNGTVNAVGQSTTVTFEYGTTVAYGTTVTADQSPVTGSTDTAVSIALTGLTPATTYHYRAVGQNVNGTTYGADMTFFTGTPALPTATTDAATSVMSDGATLNGTVNANNDPATVTFEYGTTAAYGTTVTADQSPVTGAVNTAVSFDVTGLGNNTTYHYRVVAVNGSGTVNGADMTFTTSSRPVAITGAATNLLFSSVTLNGMVNNNNNITATNITFDYGLTAAYGTNTAGVPSFATGTTDTNAILALTGLAPGTTYHYRINGQSAFGTTNGADMTFTTPIGPDATTDAATSVGSNAATFNGTVNARNASTIVTFEYGLDTNYGQTVVADQSPVTGSTNTAVSFTSIILTPNTTYYFRVVAINANGTVYGADMNFTTTSLAPTAVTVPASGISSTGATLNGTVNGNNDSTTVTFEYGTTVAYGTTLTAAQSPVTGNSNNAVSAIIAVGLTANTTYHFRVVAQNGSGTTNGADITFFTGISAPAAATNAATQIGSDFATLNGNVNANNGETTVTFEIGTTLSYGNTVIADQSPLTGSNNTAVSFNYTGLVGNTAYHYRVVAQNGSGTTYGADMTFTTNVAGTPIVTTGNASSVGNRAATFNGTVNPNSFSTTITFQYGTTIAYGSTLTADQSPLTGSANIAVSKRATGLFPNTTYHYRVVGENINGQALGDDMTFTTGVVAPFVRTDEATSLSTSGATLNGMVNAGNLDTSVFFEYGLDITYGTSVNGVPAMVSGSEDSSISAVLTGLKPNTTYHYRAIGENAEGRSFGVDRTFFTGNSNPPEIDLNREKINFGTLYGNMSIKTPNQTLLINNIGGSTLQWSLNSSESWINCTPVSGSGSGITSVNVDISGLSAGRYTGYISISDPEAVNSPVSVEIVLNVLESSSSPFGAFSTPVDGSTVSGSVPVTGWIIDDIGVTQIRLYTEEMGLKIYIGDAVMVEGARPDVEDMYPDYPENYKAGWGYMLLTNLLQNGGNGTYTLVAQALDIEGNAVTLGSKTIICDNANAVKPFGTIDTPAQGGIATGSDFINWGWALTPQPNYIPEDGSTINVYLDGVNLGHPTYNIFRADIASLFPGYQNSNGAVGYYSINTTSYANGVHSIQWTATDSAGNMDGIGSRYFSILNIGSKSSGSYKFNSESIDNLPHNTEQLTNVKGEGLINKFASYADENNVNTFKSKEQMQIEIKSINGNKIIYGYSYDNYKTGKLPPGSTIDGEKGRFYWIPPVGFYGKYGFVFIIRTSSGQLERKYISIDILPKFNSLEQ